MFTSGRARAAAVLFAAATASLSAPAETLPRRLGPLVPSAAELKRVPVDVVAEETEADNTTGWITANRKVLITYGDSELRADRVRLNVRTGWVEADGNVMLVRRNRGAIKADRLRYNYKTEEGLVNAIDLRAGSYRMLADDSRRERDGKILMHDAKITTCTNAPGRMHYHLDSRELTLQPDDYFAARGIVPYIFGVPVFYFPYWRRELDEHYGFRFVPGYDSQWGAFLLSSYKFRLFAFGDDGSLKSRTHLDYRSERGFAAGQDLLWDEESLGRGFVSAYFIDDEEPMDTNTDPRLGEIDNQRYRYTLRHDVALSDRDALAVRASYLSDPMLLEDFYEDEFRQLRQPENYVDYTHIGDNYAAGVSARSRLNEFYESVNRLPELWLDVNRNPIMDSPVYYESQTRGGWLQHEFADYGNPSNPPPDSVDTVRLDSSHMLFLPRKLGGFLSVVPRAGYRGTYYGDTLEQQTVTGIASETTTNSLGEVVLAGSPVQLPGEYGPGGDAALRSLFELGLETSFRSYGLFEGPAGIFRHVVEPYANYTYVPEPNVRPFELHTYDDIDRLDMTHQVRLGTRQQIQRRGEKGVRTTVDADLFGVYEFEDPNGDSGLDVLGVDSRFRPADWMRFDLNALYDVEEGELSKVDSWVRLWNKSLWEARGEFYYRPDESALVAGSLTYALTEDWSVNVFSRYEAESGRLEEQGGYVQYQLDCLVFRLKGRYLPGYDRADGSEREDDYRVSFYVWLRAFPRDRDDHLP